MKITLVSMPWHTIRMPQHSLGILEGVLQRDRPEVQVEQLHANLLWADFLLKESNGRIALAD